MDPGRRSLQAHRHWVAVFGPALFETPRWGLDGVATPPPGWLLKSSLNEWVETFPEAEVVNGRWDPLESEEETSLGFRERKTLWRARCKPADQAVPHALCLRTILESRKRSPGTNRPSRHHAPPPPGEELPAPVEEVPKAPRYAETPRPSSPTPADRWEEGGSRRSGEARGGGRQEWTRWQASPTPADQGEEWGSWGSCEPWGAPTYPVPVADKGPETPACDQDRRDQGWWQHGDAGTGGRWQQGQQWWGRHTGSRHGWSRGSSWQEGDWSGRES